MYYNIADLIYCHAFFFKEWCVYDATDATLSPSPPKELWEGGGGEASEGGGVRRPPQRGDGGERDRGIAQLGRARHINNIGTSPVLRRTTLLNKAWLLLILYLSMLL